jgi:hypothetical protein
MELCKGSVNQKALRKSLWVREYVADGVSTIEECNNLQKKHDLSG